METRIIDVTWGTGFIKTGLGRPLTRWERLRFRLRFWWLRYLFEDLSELTFYRVRGAWRVLLGRAHWY